MGHLFGYNPQQELVGSYIQAKNQAIEECTSEKECGFEVNDKPVKLEKKSDRIARMKAF